jgi:hypothetical protein
MSISPIVMSIIMAIGVVSPESSIVPVAIEVATIAIGEVTSMLVGVPIHTTLRGVVPLVKGFSVVLASIESPFAVLFLPDVVVQCDSLIK